MALKRYDMVEGHADAEGSYVEYEDLKVALESMRNSKFFHPEQEAALNEIIEELL
jgi:hypothetical protein